MLADAQHSDLANFARDSAIRLSTTDPQLNVRGLWAILSMLKMVGSGIAMFGALLIANLLMKIFGNPLIDSIPSGTWGVEQLKMVAVWLATPNAVFWWMAAATTLLAIAAWRSRLLTEIATVVVTTTLIFGVIAGVMYRLMNLSVTVAIVALDPAFLFIVSGAIAPFILWALKRGVEEAIWSLEQRRENLVRVKRRQAQPLSAEQS